MNTVLKIWKNAQLDILVDRTSSRHKTLESEAIAHFMISNRKQFIQQTSQFAQCTDYAFSFARPATKTCAAMEERLEPCCIGCIASPCYTGSQLCAWQMRQFVSSLWQNFTELRKGWQWISEAVKLETDLFCMLLIFSCHRFMRNMLLV